MENFDSIKTLYDHLEKNALNYKYSHQIGDLFQRLRDLNENNPDVREKAQWEVDSFSFRLNEGKLKSMSTIIDTKGEVISYPCMEKFDEKICGYLTSRLEITSNPYLKARYSHILWLSPKKHQKYAKESIDAYLELIKIYEEKDEIDPTNHYGLDIIETLKIAYSLSCQVNYKLDFVKAEIKRLIKQFNFKSSSSSALRVNLIELMLEGKNKFSKGDFIGYEDVCLMIYNALLKSGNDYAAIKILEIGEEVAKRIGEKAHNWRKKIAELYESLMEKGEKEKSFTSLIHWQKAIDSYKKIGDKSKIKELENKYPDLRSKIEFKSIETGIDLKPHFENFKAMAKEISRFSSKEIIEFLMLEKKLLPKYQDMVEIVNEQKEQFGILNIFSQKLIDQKGNIAQHFYSDEEIKYYRIIENYRFEIEFKIFLINEIFFASIMNKKLSTDVLLDFFKKNSWVGKTIRKELPNNKTIEYNWLSLIAPSIHDYFIQMQYYFINPSNIPNLVLSIDSLTLKIEGLIRDICKSSNVPTFYTTKDKKGREITREKDIHSLLYEEKIKELFDEDDLLFSRFLLVEQAGYNLRHRVAHSLMIAQEYGINYMHLLILALLRIGKYDFVKKEEGKGERSEC